MTVIKTIAVFLVLLGVFMLFNQPKKLSGIEVRSNAVANVKVGTYKSGDFTIEMTGVEKIDGGVQVFARVWENGNQLGFGEDGSVDIERFIIKNPPTHVPDGTFNEVRKVNMLGELIVSQQPNFVYDPKRALVEVIVQTVELKKQKFNSDKIQFGKVGNTTLTAYASPDGGAIFSEGNPGRSWASLKAQSGNNSSPTAATGLDTFTIAATTMNQWRYLGQGHFGFDTSSIGSETVTSATFSVYGSTTNGGKRDNSGMSLSVVESNYATDPIANSDYEQFNTTKWASDMTIAAWTNSAYNDFALNASGLAGINTSGTTKIALVLKEDVDNSAPSWGSGVLDGIDTTYSETSGTTQDPKLVVESSAANNGEEYIQIYD